MLAIVNPASAGGRGLIKWRRLEPHLARALVGMEVCLTRRPREESEIVAAGWAAGHREFLAGGGDGTVNAVLDALLACVPPGARDSVTLGAVALGSSNDFHKPCRAVVAGVPCRVEFAAAFPHDVGLATWTDAAGVRGARGWIVNASIGATADANQDFNHPDRVLRALKRTATGAAILFAAMRALARTRPRNLTLASDDEPPLRLATSNLGVVKNPHFTGSLSYDSPYEPASGDFTVHHLGAVSRRQLVATFATLARGRFHGRPGAQSWRARCLRVQADRPFALEIDGEVIVVTEVVFTLLPAYLRICP